jgi:DnaD/phage-associated family protein
MNDMSTPKGTGVLLQGIEGLPVQVPQTIFQHQADLGPTAALLWINLLACAQTSRPVRIADLARDMGVDVGELEQAMVILASAGWINDEGLVIRLTVPEPVQQGTLETAVAVLDEEQASFEWLVDYYAARVGNPSPEEMRKLLYWMERRQVSHEVIAVAIEEMCAGAARPSFPYLEGILRNWHAQGIRTYADLVERPTLARVLQHKPAEEELTAAELRWKEVFPDEFND